MNITSIELFAGAGGLALGFEKAGFSHLLLNDIDKSATDTLRKNRSKWNIITKSIKDIDFSDYFNKIDILSGGFPCQPFSYAGNGLGLKDIRGTVFYEFVRAIDEINPKIILIENVKGLLSHDNKKTIKIIINNITNSGYHVLEPTVLNSAFFNVPQKRERVFILAIREDLYNNEKKTFQFPIKNKAMTTLREALKAGRLYNIDVPKSQGQQYSEYKKNVLELVPQGGCWRNLPFEIQKEYMKKSFYLGGGRTGIARRIAWDEPSLTLTCSPSQKQTERCHPDETRPFTVREYARIQTFPDDWEFIGTLSSQYKQIGNAVPVNLSFSIAYEIKKYLINNNFLK